LHPRKIFLLVREQLSAGQTHRVPDVAPVGILGVEAHSADQNVTQLQELTVISTLICFYSCRVTSLRDESSLFRKGHIWSLLSIELHERSVDIKSSAKFSQVLLIAVDKDIPDDNGALFVKKKMHASFEAHTECRFNALKPCHSAVHFLVIIPLAEYYKLAAYQF